MDPITVTLKPPHPAQRQIRGEARRWNVLACGRRWGKTELGSQMAIEAALKGLPVGWFAPTYKLLEEAWDAVLEVLWPFGRYMDSNKSERRIKLASGGRIDFWTLERPNAGRGRRYARAIIDEAAMARNLEDDWTKALRPTLTDYRGDAWFCSTPHGQNYFYRLWCKGQDGEAGYASWRMPTALNPFISPEEIEAARKELPRDAFAQEYEAEFLADAANPFGVDAIRACIGDDLHARRPVVWGVDLAKSVDWTVAVGVDERGRVVAFQRWQGDWRNTAARVAAMIGRSPALVDSTGVGDPIVEQLQVRCPNVEGYKFTMQSKQQLMEGLAVAIQQRNTGFPDGVIVHELEAFQYEYTRTGVRYTAPDGMHDDCVDALALAVRCLQVRPVPLALRVLGEERDGVWMDVDNEAIWEGFD